MKKTYKLFSVTFLLVFISSLGFKNMALAQSGPFGIEINWEKVESVSKTLLSIQVCPEPPMRRGHPASKNIYKSLKGMKVDYARLQPWYPYPRLGVAELEAPKNGKTSWDFSVIDPIVIDFMEAAEGRPVMLNFSTIPQWMIKTDKPVAYPADANAIAWGYSPGNEFRDTTLKELVGYYHRLLSWYTKGGFTDEYGKYHKSGHYFKIAYWEVLNENDQDTQHLFGPQQLVKIYDAVVSDLRKLNPGMKFSALALAFPDKGGPYVSYFLDAKNHVPGIPLDMFSYHYYVGPAGNKWEEDAAALEKQEYSYFENIDGFLKTVSRLDSIRKAVSPKTKTYINELGTLPVGDPADPNLVIPDFYWPISSAMFAYAYANLVKQGIDVLAIAELIDYPGQFAGTTITDWNTGLPNARYWGMKLLQDNFGLKDKLVFTTQPGQTLFAQAFITAGAKRKVLLVNKSNHIITAKLPHASQGKMSFVDVSTGHQPAKTVLLKNEYIVLQAHAVAVITLIK
jgi:hypothetical protein